MLRPEKETPCPSVPASEKGTRGGSSDLLRRLSRYGSAKAHTVNIATELGRDRLKAMGINYPTRILECGDWLKFRDYYTGPGVKLHGANFCKQHLVCTLCAIRRASRMMASYVERFQVIKEKCPSLNPYLATLTVRNSHDLRQVLEHLLASLKILHERRTRRNTRTIMSMIFGGVYAVELTHDHATGWHPHVHAIWLAEEEPNTYALRSEWEKITGDSFMCDVRPIVADGDLPADIDPHTKGFAECFKYAMKPTELGAERIEKAFPILAGRRLVGSFGLFRGVPAPDDLSDDTTGLQDLPYFEFFARYCAGAYSLHRTRTDEHTS